MAFAAMLRAILPPPPRPDSVRALPELECALLAFDLQRADGGTLEALCGFLLPHSGLAHFFAPPSTSLRCPPSIYDAVALFSALEEGFQAVAQDEALGSEIET